MAIKQTVINYIYIPKKITLSQLRRKSIKGTFTRQLNNFLRIYYFAIYKKHIKTKLLIYL